MVVTSEMAMFCVTLVIAREPKLTCMRFKRSVLVLIIILVIVLATPHEPLDGLDIIVFVIRHESSK